MAGEILGRVRHRKYIPRKVILEKGFAPHLKGGAGGQSPQFR